MPTPTSLFEGPTYAHGAIWISMDVECSVCLEPSHCYCEECECSLCDRCVGIKHEHPSRRHHKVQIPSECYDQETHSYEEIESLDSQGNTEISYVNQVETPKEANSYMNAEVPLCTVDEGKHTYVNALGDIEPRGINNFKEASPHQKAYLQGQTSTSSIEGRNQYYKYRNSVQTASVVMQETHAYYENTGPLSNAEKQDRENEPNQSFQDLKSPSYEEIDAPSDHEEGDHIPWEKKPTDLITTNENISYTHQKGNGLFAHGCAVEQEHVVCRETETLEKVGLKTWWKWRNFIQIVALIVFVVFCCVVALVVVLVLLL